MLLAAVGGVTAIAFGVGSIPAWSAAYIDPAVGLRRE